MGLLLIAYDQSQGECTSNALLSKGLLTFCGWETIPTIARTPRGKPFFPDFPQIHYNISHSGSFLLLGIADSPIGVDIEAVRPRRAALPRYALTKEEYELFLSFGGSWTDFYTLWTAKEAYCKYTGEGLSRPSRLIVPKSAPLKTVSARNWCAAVVCDALEESSDIYWLSETP